jgi:hypothetical protein
MKRRRAGESVIEAISGKTVIENPCSVKQSGHIFRPRCLMKFGHSTGMRAASKDSIEQDGANSDATRDACAK